MNVSELINRQRKIKISLAEFEDFILEIENKVEEAKRRFFVVGFVSDRQMIELNKSFRGINKTTDVLSFPHEPDEFTTNSLLDPSNDTDADGSAQDSDLSTHDFLGDIVISAEQAERQAKENKLTLESEIKQLILHGVLHLCGYDHETDSGEMNAREITLRDKLNI